MKQSRAAWIAAAVLVPLWTVLGVFFDHSTRLGWLPKWALAASLLAPAGWIAIYTVQGLAGRGKWWRSDLGVNLVWLQIADISTNGLIAWAVWFNNGLLNTPALAWAYIGGLLAGALIISWRAVIWLRSAAREAPLLARLHDLEADNAALRERLSES